MPAQSPRLPKISVIQSFKVAAELGSLAKAAAQLALTPAAVSQQIRQLEEQLGSALFLRTQSGVMLTETGKEYLRYVTEAFDILHLGQQNIRHAASAPRLTVYALPALASKWLLPQLASWRTCCPDIDLSLHGTHARWISPPSPPILLSALARIVIRSWISSGCFMMRCCQSPVRRYYSALRPERSSAMRL
jgi:LysR family glycine cleavage system transcriptional activator